MTHISHLKFCLLFSDQPEHADATPGIGIKYDMQWQKRGSGRKYDSLSGVGTCIGNKTGLVLGCEVRSKDCRICSLMKAANKPVTDHACNCNWAGTSKGMEPDVAISIVKKIEETKQCNVNVLVMDEDATTISRVRSELDHEVEKWSDISHVRKHVGNALWKLNKKYQSQLTAPVIDYFQRCFVYAVHQNKNNPDQLRIRLNAIIPHAFGNHTMCNETWCKGCTKENYEHSTLGCDLQGDELKTDLTKVFSSLSDRAEHLAPCGSTAVNESMNNLITSKAPKSRHYSSSNSLQNRVSCCVLQKNKSYGYVCDVNERATLSPGKVTKIVASRIARKRKQVSTLKSSLPYKRRRIQKKLQFSKVNKSRQVREGTTYQTGIDMADVQDIENIPAPVSASVTTPRPDECKCVYFDIETSSLKKDCDIVQISAICDDKCFDRYILPSEPISPRSSDVNGLTFTNGKLYLHNKVVAAQDKKSALSEFVNWLQDFTTPLLLVGHNAHTFDSPRLVSALLACDCAETFRQSVIGISDTLSAFKDVFPKLTSYKQEGLYNKIVGEQYNAHNSMDDVKALQNLVKKAQLSQSVLLKHSRSCEFLFKAKDFDANVSTLKPLIDEKVISNAIAKKIGYSGLNFTCLKTAFARKGLGDVLSERDTNNKVRVTNRKSIINGLSKYFSQH